MKTIITSLIISIFSFIGTEAHAQQIENRGNHGDISLLATNIKLTCLSEDGKTSIKGYVPGSTYNNNLTMIHEGFQWMFIQSYTQTPDVIMATTQSLLSGVFTVNARSLKSTTASKTLELASIPTSMVGYYENNGFKVSFKANFLIFYIEKEEDCDDCIVTPVGIEKKLKNIAKSGIANCEASFRALD